jgi:hypothetical protein
MSEVREQASHAATLRIQRGKILKRKQFFERWTGFQWLRMHA